METHAATLVTEEDYTEREAAFVECVTRINRIDQDHLNERLEAVNRELVHLRATITALSCTSRDNDVLQRLGAAQTALKSTTGERENLRKMLAIVSPTEAELKQRFTSIWAVPRVCDVWIENGRLTYRTLPLFGKDHGRKWRRIGAFQISFDMQCPEADSFMWRNLDGTRDVDGQPFKLHGPPNIFENSMSEDGMVVCAGTLANSVIEQATATRDYAALVSFSVRYPECAGHELNQNISLWPMARREDVPSWYIAQFGR